MQIIRTLAVMTVCVLTAAFMFTPVHAQVTESVTTTATPVPDAVPAPTATPAATATSPLLAAPSVSSSGVPMVSGGIGDDDLAHMKTLEGQYNLKLLFSEHNGVYLANVHVQIDDKDGTNVVTTVAKGPIILLTLPAGAYKVTATESGESHEQAVNVSEKSLASYVIRFRTEDPVKSN